MTQEEFTNILNGVGIPVRYDHGEEGLAVPFIYYTFVRGTALNADNVSYSTKNTIEINLVTTSKAEQHDLSLKLEGLLTANEIPYGSPDEGWSSSEKIYLLTYTLEV